LLIGWNSGTTGFTPSGLINLTSGSNCIVMGNANHTLACIQIAWSAVSDIRDKHIYGLVPHGRDFLRKINPIKYAFKDRETNEITDDRVRYGFSAQEVLEQEGAESVIVNDSNPDKLGITGEYMIPVLVNAIKELDAENTLLKVRLQALEERVGITSS